jgi:hypothetical protein
MRIKRDEFSDVLEACKNQRQNLRGIVLYGPTSIRFNRRELHVLKTRYGALYCIDRCSELKYLDVEERNIRVSPPLEQYFDHNFHPIRDGNLRRKYA